MNAVCGDEDGVALEHVGTAGAMPPEFPAADSETICVVPAESFDPAGDDGVDVWGGADYGVGFSGECADAAGDVSGEYG